MRHPTNVPFPLREFVDRLAQGQDPPVCFECLRVEMKERTEVRKYVGGENVPVRVTNKTASLSLRKGTRFFAVSISFAAQRSLYAQLTTLCSDCGLLTGSGCLLALRSRSLLLSGSLLTVGGRSGHCRGRHVGDHIARILSRGFGEEARGHAENDQEGGEGPSGFLDKVRRLANTEHRVGTRNIRSKPATFGFLNENHDGQQDSRDNGQND